MSRSTRRLASLAAAVCYGVLALASHGLHEWVGCTDGSCASVSASHGCSGHCCHDAACEPSRHDADGSRSFRAYAAGHDAANCAVCAWVAKLKTSVFALAAAPIAAQATEPASPSYELLIPHAAPLALTARGPPAAQA